MGTNLVFEPVAVIALLAIGTWINRVSGGFSQIIQNYGHRSRRVASSGSQGSLEAGLSEPTSEDGLLRGRPLSSNQDRWRKRLITIFGSVFRIPSPNNSLFQNSLPSRLLRGFPFLLECWYWAVVYFTYQGGRAITALTFRQGTVDIARKHALQLIWIEKKLGIFWEIEIQKFFLQHAWLMTMANWVYCFIHIPGTIAFLVWFYYYSVTLKRQNGIPVKPSDIAIGSSAGPLMYEARRRALALCNLLAFVVFTLWPCMPPRLLSDKNVNGPEGELGRRYGFVDTVHDVDGMSSVWTENRLCNHYAAMPSLHFGYALIIGFTIAGIPLSSGQRRTIARPRFFSLLRLSMPSFRRLLCVAVGMAYPSIILTAVVATANHFILDGVAGALVCAVGWRFNGVLLNLLPLEDYFLWVIRASKPMLIANPLKDAYNDITGGDRLSS